MKTSAEVGKSVASGFSVWGEGKLWRGIMWENLCPAIPPPTPYTHTYIPGLEYSITWDNILYIKIQWHDTEAHNWSFQRILGLERGLDILWIEREIL